jgi:hypothetical protein
VPPAQVVANATNGVDVDKVDYLQRDALLAGVGQSYNFTALLKNCRVSCATALSVHCMAFLYMSEAACCDRILPASVGGSVMHLWRTLLQPHGSVEDLHHCLVGAQFLSCHVQL